MTRHSQTRYLLLLGGAPISWKTKKQFFVSRSFVEVEYRVMATTISEIIWMRWLLKELGVEQHVSTTLFCDNQVSRHIANNPIFHERTKHVKIDCYFVRQRVESKKVQPIHVDTMLQLVDLFMKGLGAQHMRFLLDKLGICDIHAPLEGEY